jgi:hypothetical protein
MIEPDAAVAFTGVSAAKPHAPVWITERFSPASTGGPDSTRSADSIGCAKVRALRDRQHVRSDRNHLNLCQFMAVAPDPRVAYPELTISAMRKPERSTKCTQPIHILPTARSAQAIGFSVFSVEAQARVPYGRSFWSSGMTNCVSIGSLAENARGTLRSRTRLYSFTRRRPYPSASQTPATSSGRDLPR